MRGLLLFVLPIALLGCAYRVSQFRGDGTLVDHGLAEATHRYVLDLGAIGTPEATYVLENLPPREFTLGLEVTGPEGECVHDTRPIDPDVTFRLENELGELVVAEAAPLRDWVWSATVECDHAFVYRKGLSRERAAGGEAYTLERTEVRADDGWGTYFTPRRSAAYRLTVTLSEARFDPYRLRLKAKTGGWK